MEPLREVPLARVEVGQVELRCNPDSQAAPQGWTPCARLPWLTGARKRTQCGRTVSQQARQGWYGRRRCSPGEKFSCSQRKASTLRRSLRSLPASFVQNRKELITYHSLTKKRPSARPVARSHCAGSTNCGTSLACKRRRAVCCVHCAGAGRRARAPTCDVQQTPRGAAHAERSACASRGQTAAARCRPVGPARPRGGGGGRACLARARPGEEHLVRGAA